MMKQLVYSIISLGFILLIHGCTMSGKTVTGNGQVTSESRGTGTFDELMAAGPMHVFLTQGPAQAARIEAESNLLPYIEIRHDDDKLEIRVKRNINLKTHHPVNVYLTAPEVDELSMVGSGEIEMRDTLHNNGEIKLNIAGSGNIRMAVNAPEINANIAGSGDIIISGQTRDLEINLAGSGDFKGENLKSEQTDVKIAGSGDARVYASIKLETKVLGSGNVYYRGNPAVETRQAGSGRVVKQ